MKTSRLMVTTALAALIPSLAYAADSTIVYRIKDVNTLQTGHLLKDGKLHIQIPGLRGGDFEYQSSHHTADGGVWFDDADGNTYQRDLLSDRKVHLNWYGVTTNSSDVAPTLALAQTAAATLGSNVVTCDAMKNLKVQTPVEIKNGMRLTCDAPQDGAELNSDYTSLAGSFEMYDAAYFYRTHGVDNNTEMDHLATIPKWYIDNGLPTTIPGVMDLVANMASHNAVGVDCEAEACNDHDMRLLGQDTGYMFRNAPRNRVDNVKVDADVHFWGSSTGGSVHWGNTIAYPFLTKDLNIPTLSYSATTTNNSATISLTNITGINVNDNITGTNIPANDYVTVVTPGAGLTGTITLTKNTSGAGATTLSFSNHDNNTEWWTVDGIDSDPTTHECRIHVAGNISDIHSTYKVNTSKLGDRTRCEGRWSQTVSGNYITLTGSIYADPTTTASWTAGYYVIDVASTAGWAHGQTITGVAGIVDGSQVVSVSRDTNMVVLDTKTTANGSSVSITPNDTNFDTPVHCGGGGSGTCIWISAQGRQVAGSSTGGVASGNVAVGYYGGGPSGSDSIAGWRLGDTQSYGNDIQYWINGSNNISFHQAGADNDGNVDDPFTTHLKITGSNGNIEFIGTKSGKNGVSLQMNNTGDGCLKYYSSNASATRAQFAALELIRGCVIIDGVVNTAKGYAQVANSTGQIFAHNELMSKMDWEFEGDAAQGMIMGSGNIFASGYADSFNHNASSQKQSTTGTLTKGSSTIPDVADITNVTAGMTISASGIPGGDTVTTVVNNGLAFPNDKQGTVTFDTLPATRSGSKTIIFLAHFPAPPIDDQTDEHHIQADNQNSQAIRDMFHGFGAWICRRAEGTNGTPTLVTTNKDLCRFGATAYDGTNWPQISSAGLVVETCADQSTSNHCTDVYIEGDKANGTSVQRWLTFINGHMQTSGSQPTIAAGTAPTWVDSKGSDQGGRIDVGTTAPSTLGITFVKPYTFAPLCQVWDETTVSKNPMNITAVNTTGFTATGSGNLVDHDKVGFTCQGYQ